MNSKTKIQFQRLVWIIIGIHLIQCRTHKSNYDLSSFLFSNPPISEIYFSSPGRDIPLETKRKVKEVILSEIRKSKESIRLYVYSLDDYEIITELYAKKRAGLDIQIFGDKEEDYEEVESLGFQVNRWEGTGIHHTKIFLFDRIRLFMGTGNFTTHGLETDHNVYWIQNLTSEESENLILTLSGKNSLGRVPLGSLEYLFAPEAGLEIQSRLLDAIDGAKFSIRYLIYSHYDPVFTLKIWEASKRGVIVQAIYNVPMNPEAEFLRRNLNQPSQIWEDGNVDFVFKNESYRGGLLHHKTMLVDEKDVYVGSYNYSVSARDKNKEYFVKMDHPLVTHEFLMEWERIRSNAIPVSLLTEVENPNNQSGLHAYSFQRFQNSLFETNLVFQMNGNLDSNANALSKQYETSLSLDGLTFVWRDPLGANRFILSSNSVDPIWEESVVSDLNLSLQSYFFGTKVTLSNGERVVSVSIWDGTNPKETIILDDSSFAMARSDFRVGKNLWMWVQTEERTISFCHTKQKGSFPKWMVFLLNRLHTKQNQNLLCSND